MKVIKSEENLLSFDNGLDISSEHNQDCCEYNFLDFGQFVVGDEFPTCNTEKELLNEIDIKEDGFIFKDVNGIPKYAQARSVYGYYSNMLNIVISLPNGQETKIENIAGEVSESYKF